MVYKSKTLNFGFRKLEFDMIQKAYSNESIFKWGLEYGKTCSYNT